MKWRIVRRMEKCVDVEKEKKEEEEKEEEEQNRRRQLGGKRIRGIGGGR